MTKKIIGIMFVCILLIISGCKNNEEKTTIPLIESEGPSEVISKPEDIQVILPITYPFFIQGETQLLWGLKDDQNHIKIEPVYDFLEFEEGLPFYRAHKDEVAYLIDEDGRILFESVHEEYSERLDRYLNQVTDFMVPFFDEGTQKFGYKQNGNIVIKPIYYEAAPFLDHYAVVALNESLSTYAVIDSSGTTYWSVSDYQITNLGHGFFGMRDTLNHPDLGLTPMTVHDYHGVLVFDASYFEVLPLASGDFFVYDGYQGFFVDKKGERTLTEIEFEGYLTYRQLGSVIEARTDFGFTLKLAFIDQNGNLLWQDSARHELTSEKHAIQQTYERQLVQATRFLKIDSVIINDESNVKLNQVLQEKIDARVAQYASLADELSSTEIVSTIEFLDGYALLTTDYFQYANGAAHGNYDYTYDYFDLLKNEWIGLNDLFEDFTLAQDILTDYVRRILLAKGFEASEQITIDNDRLFTLSESSLNIHFQLYEIGPYVVGMPEIEIPYLIILDYLSENGPLNMQQRISTIGEGSSSDNLKALKEHIYTLTSQYSRLLDLETLELYEDLDTPLRAYWSEKFAQWQTNGIEKVPAFSFSTIRKQEVFFADFEGDIIELSLDYVFEMEDGTVEVQTERTFYYFQNVEDSFIVYMAVDSSN